MLVRQKDIPLSIRLEGFETKYSWNIPGFHTGNARVEGFGSQRVNRGDPYPLHWYNTSPTGWGCGIQAILGSVATLLFPEIWEDKEFVNSFREFYGFNATMMMCITDTQLNHIKTNGVMKKWEELFIVHECGSFPNYSHGPENMNLITLNISENRKKEFPVPWDKLNKREKQNENIQQVAPTHQQFGVVRDSTVSTAASE